MAAQACGCHVRHCVFAQSCMLSCLGSLSWVTFGGASPPGGGRLPRRSHCLLRGVQVVWVSSGQRLHPPAADSARAAGVGAVEVEQAAWQGRGRKGEVPWGGGRRACKWRCSAAHAGVASIGMPQAMLLPAPCQLTGPSRR